MAWYEVLPVRECPHRWLVEIASVIDARGRRAHLVCELCTQIQRVDLTP